MLISELLKNSEGKIQKLADLLVSAKMTGKVIIEINVRNGGIGRSTIEVLPGKENLMTD